MVLVIKFHQGYNPQVKIVNNPFRLKKNPPSPNEITIWPWIKHTPTYWMALWELRCSLLVLRPTGFHINLDLGYLRLYRINIYLKTSNNKIIDTLNVCQRSVRNLSLSALPPKWQHNYLSDITYKCSTLALGIQLTGCLFFLHDRCKGTHCNNSPWNLDLNIICSKNQWCGLFQINLKTVLISELM